MYIAFVVLNLMITVLLSCKGVTAKESALTNEKIPCVTDTSNKGGGLTEALTDIDGQMKRRTGVFVLEDGASSMMHRAWFTHTAEHSIDIQYFIFSTDNIGLIACDYLVRAADRGVKIRLLVDDFMVDTKLEDILLLDSHPNISIKIYNPGITIGKNLLGTVKKLITDFKGSNQRMHNKTFIVDKKVVITGGRNIADEYFDFDHEYNFRDRDVLLLGGMTHEIDQSFETFWSNDLSVPILDLSDTVYTNTNENRFDGLHNYACNPNNYWPQIRSHMNNFPQVFKETIESENLLWIEHVEFVSDEPGKNDSDDMLLGGGTSTDALMSLMQNAQYSIAIQSPYLVTTSRGQELFKAISDKGVTVRVLTNSLASTDNLDAFNGYQRDRETLLETGIRVFEFRPDAKIRKKILTGALQKTLNYTPIFGHHAKTMVIDDSITVIGTFNLDPRSADLNTECVVIIHSKMVAKKVMFGIEEEFKPENSWETTLEFNPDSEVPLLKRINTWFRRVVPKSIL